VELQIFDRNSKWNEFPRIVIGSQVIQEKFFSGILPNISNISWIDCDIRTFLETQMLDWKGSHELLSKVKQATVTYFAKMNFLDRVVARNHLNERTTYMGLTITLLPDQS
jgi:hypothetical protein